MIIESILSTHVLETSGGTQLYGKIKPIFYLVISIGVNGSFVFSVPLSAFCGHMNLPGIEYGTDTEDNNQI